MAIRWRQDGTLVCAAKSRWEPYDIYIDDNLHYRLGVLWGVLVPDPNEDLNGLWYWGERKFDTLSLDVLSLKWPGANAQSNERS